MTTYFKWNYKLFGGDAAAQRAELYAKKNNATVHRLGDEGVPFDDFGLDCWGRGWEGIVYSHVAIINPLD